MSVVGAVGGQCDCLPPKVEGGQQKCYDDKKGVTCCGPLDSHAGVVLYFLVTLYTFLALAIICDDYFCESLEFISERLGLSEDVAGATFMAVGSSAPELFTAIVTTLITGGSEGIGTICGSAVFNIMIIVGVTALCAGQTLCIWWYPVTRDSVVYVGSIVMLYGVLFDGEVSLVESLILCSGYFGYVALMVYNSSIVSVIKSWEANKAAKAHAKKKQKWEKVQGSREEKQGLTADTGDKASGGTRGGKPAGEEFSYANPLKKVAYRMGFDAGIEERRSEERGRFFMRSMRNPAIVILAKLKFLRLSKSYQARKQTQHVAHNELPEDEDDIEKSKKYHLQKAAKQRTSYAGGFRNATEGEDDDEPLSVTALFVTMISSPLVFLFRYTVPDCGTARWADWYMLTFCMSIFWIGVFSFIMVDFAGRAGCVLEVPGLVMGLLVIAAGTSVPDALASVMVARNGQGDMAVANVLGSNVFNIFLGLGLPWMLKVAIDGEKLTINASGIEAAVLVLLVYTFLFIGILKYNQWQLNRSVAYLFFGFYVLYCIWSLLTLLEPPVLDIGMG
eukprot:g1508.t1